MTRGAIAFVLFVESPLVDSQRSRQCVSSARQAIAYNRAGSEEGGYGTGRVS
ncbi:hypothetical protein [Rubidibacter lacunae]|uniref:hypothetical protein n=1 Tax=Rubidibacter lacunae TaxID=582514 RepID=UPI000403E411|nr:hypothetical protein [Rubidibacter lacunae]